MVGLVAHPPADRVTRENPQALLLETAAWRMTTINALHTPLEQLLFFHHLKEHGAESSAFAKISAQLQENEYIRRDPAFDVDRLSPGTLQQLYLRLLKEEVRNNTREAEASETEGDSNKRKRKHSTPPLQSLEEATQHNHLLPQLVERLYARYQDHVVAEIQEEETRYDRLKREIEEIERGEWDARLEEEAKNGIQNGTVSDTVVSLERTNTQTNVSDLKNSDGRASSTEREARVSPTPQASSLSRDSDGRLAAADTSSANLLSSREEAQAQARTPAKARSPAAHATVQGMAPPKLTPHTASPAGMHTPFAPSERNSGSPAILPASGVSRSASSTQRPSDHVPEVHGQPPGGAAANSTPQQSPLHAMQQYPHGGQPYGQPPPYFPQQSQYPGYPPYPPQNAPAFHSPGQVPHSPAYSTPAFQVFPQNGHPGQAQYAGPPVPGYQSSHPGFPGYGTPQPVFQQQFHQTPLKTPQSAATRRPGLTPLNTSVASTRWKPTPGKPAKDGNKSPIAPPHSPFLPSSPELSPVDDMKLSPQPDHRGIDAGKDNTSGRGRATASAARLAGSRGNRNTRGADRGTATPDRMALSPAKESTPDRASAQPPRRQPKAEPSTPAAFTEEGATSAISTPGSTARPTVNARRTVRQSVDLGRANLKRKRANTLEGGVIGAPSPEPAVSSASLQLAHAPTRPHHVLASRNFPKVSQSLMHEINSHKFASMFAKPITERDAPGYHDIIYQPQDLKSIRAAISAGSRAVVSAEREGPSVAATAGADEAGAGNSPAVGTPTAAAGGSGPGSKGGSVWIDKTPEVVPPRGIVNGTQLEKEIVRMFANAVMFNLDPQRGFGAALRGGDGEDSDEEEEDDGEKGYEVDDGGAFVRDARDMFEDVARSVSQWRSVESGAEGARPRGVDESEADDTAADA